MREKKSKKSPYIRIKNKLIIPEFNLDGFYKYKIHSNYVNFKKKICETYDNNDENRCKHFKENQTSSETSSETSSDGNEVINIDISELENYEGDNLVIQKIKNEIMEKKPKEYFENRNLAEQYIEAVKYQLNKGDIEQLPDDDLLEQGGKRKTRRHRKNSKKNKNRSSKKRKSNKKKRKTVKKRRLRKQK
jgi:hypothetical protein